MRDIPDSFQTPRFLLRAPMVGDAPELFAAIDETWEDLHAWIPWARTRPTLADLEDRVVAAREHYIARKDLPLHIVDRSTNTLVGGIGLHRIDWHVPRFEIGYWVRKSFQRQGVAKEATTHMRDVCFDVFAARRVELRCTNNNVLSQRVAEACGFTLEARLRHFDREYIGDALCDILVYAIVR